jgi:3-oxoacyl-[acyl-carrier-protein] synthase II
MRVVVTGMGVVSPVGNEVATYWRNLTEGKSGIRSIVDYIDTEGLASTIAGVAEDVAPEGMDTKELRRHARGTAFALEAAQQALRQSGIEIAREDPYRCGVYCGSGIGGIDIIEEGVIKNHTAGPRRVSPLMVPTGITNTASGYVSIQTGFQGPNKAIVTACATGTHCIGDAADQIRMGKADVMLAGGTESTIIKFGLAGFAAMRALTTNFNDRPEAASRPFDADRDGFVMGEGAGILILESEQHAKARGAEILAEVLGLGESADAFHIAAPLEDGSGAAAAMRAALRYSKVAPENVGYFNAHGTSTKLNDAGETRALKSVFGENMPLVSSTKSMTGHLLGGAGAIEAIACIQTLRTGVVHPNINYETPDPDCDVNLVANTAKEADVAICMSNSLGFGGHNASLLFQKYD